MFSCLLNGLIYKIRFPFKLNIVVMHHPPSPLSDFSTDDYTQLVVLGDFNIPPEKLRSPEYIDFFSSFELTLSPLHRPSGPGTNSTLSS